MTISNPPATTTPPAFKTWTQAVADEVNDHEDRIVDLEAVGVEVDDAAYDATTWNGVTDTAPSKNAVRDKIEAILAGATFTGDIIVPTEAYGAGWSGSNEVPTKDAVYDKIEALVLGGAGAGSVGGPPVIVRKSSDESVTSSTTVQADDHLLFAVGTSQVWAFEFRLFVNGATAGDIKIGVQCPASATGKASMIGLASTATTSTGDVTSQGVDLSSAGPPASTLIMGVGGTTDYGCLLIHGVITTAGTAGNCTLYWGQGSSSGTATKVLADSTVVAHRLS